MNLVALAKIGIDAAKIEDAAQLVHDGETLYSLYMSYKAGSLDMAKIPPDKIKAGVNAAARTLAVLNRMVDDPAQLKNIIDLLVSL
jgi:hypothetical protein